MEEKAHINPTLLKWARIRAGMSLSAAAAKLSTSSEILRNWEKGTAYPTIREAQELAKVYKRPFAIFFLPEIPKGFRVLRDY